MLCTCPPPSEIPDLVLNACLERIDQIQKIIIQRTKNGTALNKIVIGTTDPEEKATWDALKAASDNTKVVVSPYIQNVVQEVGEAREVGSGNEVLDGIPILKGRQPSPVTCEVIDLKQTTIVSLKAYECERELSVFLINEHGWIIGRTDNTTTPDNFYGFPIRSFFVSDKMFGGYDGVDKNMIRWSFLPDFSDRLHVVVPSDFDALTEL